MEVGYDAKIEPHLLLMVREMNKTYTVEVALKMNQHLMSLTKGDPGRLRIESRGNGRRGWARNCGKTSRVRGFWRPIVQSD